MLTLAESGRLAGGFRWCELALWRALSSWAADADDPAAAVMWDSHASHAAWRAGQWWDRLPVLASVDRDELVAAPDAGWAELAPALASTGSAVGRMVGGYRVALPRLLGAYAGTGPSTSPVTDAPLRRTLTQAAADATADWGQGTFSLLRLLTDADAVDEAAATCSALERLALRRPAGEAAQ